jgi:hypothetical protein
MEKDSMRHFTGWESRYCASTVGGCSVGFARRQGSAAAGLLRQWPLLLLTLLSVTLVTEPAGAGVIKLNTALPSGGNVSSSGLQFSPDGSRVLYLADQETNNVNEIYSVASEGGTPVKLNTALPSGGNVSSSGLQFSPDGSRVLYRADQETNEVYELYSHVVKQMWNVASGQWDGAANWDQGEVPDEVMSIHVNPVSFATVTGPSSDTNIFSLNIGATDTGVATLALQPSVTLSVLNQTAISSRGALAGSGHFDSRGGLVNDGDIELDGMTIAAPTIENNGVMSGGGTIDAQLMNGVNGEVRVATGQQMHLSDTGSQSNAGRIDVIGNATQAAEIEFDGELTNAVSTGNINTSHAIMRFNDGLTNQGNMGVAFGTSHLYGDIDNQAGATISIQGNSNVAFWDDLTNSGTVHVATGSTAVYFGTITGVASFTGDGTTVVEGNLSPGNSPGAMSFAGDVVLGSASTTLMELAGVSVGAEHDQLVIAGVLNLNGTLDLVHLAPYTDPAVRGTSDDFVLINAGARSGNFNTVQYDESALTADFTTDGNGSFRNHAGGGLFRGVTYTATTVQLQNLLALKGDTDGDADVDLADYNRLATNFDPVGSLGPHGWPDGNTDGDGDIDLADYNALAGNFSPAGYGAAAVPEPASVCLLLAALLVLSWVRFQAT